MAEGWEARDAGLPGCASLQRSRGCPTARPTNCASDLATTPHQIQAIIGHTTLKEVEGYTRAASQKLMAEMAMRGIEPVALIEGKKAGS